MKITPPLILSSIALILSSQAETILFDLSPPGSGDVPGLSPANEVPSITGEVSGDAVFSGISFDTEEAHSALYDCSRTAELFCLIVNRWKDLGGWPPLTKG